MFSRQRFSMVNLSLAALLVAAVGVAVLPAFLPETPERSFLRVPLPRGATPAKNRPSAAELPPAVVEESRAPVSPEVLEAVEESERQAAVPAANRPASIEYLNFAFDLADIGKQGEEVSGEAIVVRKVLRMAGKDIGSAPIHVDKSRLLIDVADLQRLFRSAGVDSPLNDRKASGALASFGDLRQSGVDLRYDPATDTIAVTVG